MEKIQKLILVAVIAGGTLTLLRCAFWHVPPQGIGWGEMTFDSRSWKKANPRDPRSLRGKMLRSLVKEHHLIGMKRSEVLTLLGRPDGTNNSIHSRGVLGSQNFNEASTWHYVLGAYSGFGVDFDILSLYFDKTGKVERWAVWQS